MTELAKLCEKALTDKNLDQRYKDRLKEELWHIDAQDEHEYFLSIKEKYANENNLLIPYLLNICSEFDIDKESGFTFQDFPDIDLDYLPPVRDYLKEIYAPKQFGQDYVCNICAYTTFKLRSSLLDMARVFGLDKDEIQNITKQLAVKDDDGEILTWDTALELYDELKKYLDLHPEMKEAAHRILDRNRSLSQHASGLIISGKPIKDFVPLVRGKEGSVASAWVEGLQGTDLGAVGLVKFDFLSLDGNFKIALACHLAKQRHGLKGISAIDGKGDWSNTEYLNDEKAITMANKGDLRLVFQFDGSEGIRNLAKQGGVSSFDDLAAYTALFRPGPMKTGLHTLYCKRKKKEEEYELHPLLQPILGTTYGCLVYQEQIMKILNVVGKIPLKDCETVRKAISKKKVEYFRKFKDMFVKNGQINLGWTKEELETLWNQIEAFAGYCFNMSHTVAYTYISSRMLYLKANFPLEFYCAFLTFMNVTGPKDHQKLKEYKRDAEAHGIELAKVDLNKSSDKFSIVDDKIYFGFSNLRGIGEQVGKAIADNRPYKDIDDFMSKCGTEQRVMQAFICLGLFGENKIELYQYYLAHKDYESKKKARIKRHEEALKKIQDELKAADEEETVKLMKKYNTKINNFHKNTELYVKPTMGVPVDIEDEDVIKLLTDITTAEFEFYGFAWSHPLDKYTSNNRTIEQAMEDAVVCPLEVLIMAAEEKKSKTGTTYYTLQVEDRDGEVAWMTIWADDWKRWNDELQPGRMVSLRVNPPKGHWRNFTLESHVNRYKPPAKENDHRVKVLNTNIDHQSTTCSSFESLANKITRLSD